MIDLHMHTPRCRHADGTPQQYVDAARAAGLRTVCFTDHLPLPAGYPSGYAMDWAELPDYVDEIRALAAASRDAGGPEVLCGIEADWLPGADQLLGGAHERHGFDMVLGSVHFVGDWAFDDPDLIDRYSEWDIAALWERYFHELGRAAASGLFDVMAHPDLVKKFGFRPDGDVGALYESVGEALAGAGVAVEVNAAGLRKPVREIYPSLGLLQVLHRHGVPATMGSDAHAPDEVGRGLDEARELLLAAGYRSVLVFRGRVAEEVAL